MIRNMKVGLATPMNHVGSGCDLRDYDLIDVRIPTVENLNIITLNKIEADPSSFDVLDWHLDSDGFWPKPGCGTIHCRAGWAIHLSGEAGYQLEKEIGSESAAALIIAKSCPWLEKVPNLFESKEEVIADIRRCAEREKEMG